VLSSVKCKNKLAKLEGSINFYDEYVPLEGAFINHPNSQELISDLVSGYVIFLGYVNTKMVE
jgi:hypothetical protein